MPIGSSLLAALPVDQLSSTGVNAEALTRFAGMDFVDVQMDSRAIGPGDLFVAVPGTQSDGRDFIADAARRGAQAVLAEANPGAALREHPVLVIPVDDLRLHLGPLAAAAYPRTSELRVWGVTGTNGKTTVAYVLARLLTECGVACGFVGTIGVGIPGREPLRANALTTADVLSNHRMLQSLAAAGAQVVAMEVSSHALSQDRVAQIPFFGAIFTNLTRDHLDYHGDLASYGAAKARLFAVQSLAHKVINIDDDFGRSLLGSSSNAPAAQLHTYSRATAASSAPARVSSATATSATWRAVTSDLRGTRAQLRLASALAPLATPGTPATGAGEVEVPVDSPLVGAFNLDNLAAVVLAARASGVSSVALTHALPQVPAPPGRLESVTLGGGVIGLVDYAHTPDALEQVLRVIRELRPRAIHCVFGCGGERDIGKRALMGNVAERFADTIILTNDNPRSESPDNIFADIRSGLTSASAHRVVVLPDRNEAIAAAVALAMAGDIVLVAGKGHETQQRIGTRSIEQSDLAVLRRLARARHAQGAVLTAQTRSPALDVRQRSASVQDVSAPVSTVTASTATALDLAEGASVVVLGLGATGQSCVAALGEHHPIVALDSRREVPGFAQWQEQLSPPIRANVQWHFGDFEPALVAQADLVIASPGIAGLDCLLAEVKRQFGVTPRVRGDIDVFCALFSAPVLGVTGTNGKSTVVTLLGHLLRELGMRVAVGGNLGPPALALLSDPADMAVLELSSFQLELCHELRLAAATILNVGEDHIDRHGSVADYRLAKQKIFDGTPAVVSNRADGATRGPGSATQITFGLDTPAHGEFGVATIDGRDWLAYHGASIEYLLPADQCSLLGRHNIANMLASLALLAAAGLPWRNAVPALRTFEGLPHRFERVQSGDGVVWINDSKATNVDATCAALAGLTGDTDQRQFLILGGDTKAADLQPLAKPIANAIDIVLTIGRDAARFADLLANTGVQVIACGDLDSAVGYAAAHSQPGDVVLLSPASASLDQFPSFVARGNRFAALVSSGAGVAS